MNSDEAHNAFRRGSFTMEIRSCVVCEKKVEKWITPLGKMFCVCSPICQEIIDEADGSETFSGSG